MTLTRLVKPKPCNTTSTFGPWVFPGEIYYCMHDCLCVCVCVCVPGICVLSANAHMETVRTVCPVHTLCFR